MLKLGACVSVSFFLSSRNLFGNRRLGLGSHPMKKTLSFEGGLVFAYISVAPQLAPLHTRDYQGSITFLQHVAGSPRGHMLFPFGSLFLARVCSVAGVFIY